MDWGGVIEKNREALRRVLAALVAMAGLEMRGQFTHFPAVGAARPGPEAGEMSKLSPHFLPRRLHRAVLRLLRPSESAVRRLVIIAARGLVVTLPPPRLRKDKPKPTPKPAAPVPPNLGIAVLVTPAEFAAAAAAERAAAEKRAAEKRAAARANRMPSLPLVDPLQNPLRRRVRYTPAHRAPRILSFDGRPPRRLPPPPSADDPIDATPLARRLTALSRALDDLPGHARRFARWKARRHRARAQGRRHRIWPLKPGFPPGLNRATSRRPTHEVHEILKNMQYFAYEVLEHPDTS